MLKRLFALLVLMCAAAPALAAPDAAMRLYAEGAFVAAADSAQAQPSAASLTLASRALMAACVTSPRSENVDTWLARAEDAARAALRLDPDSVEARLQLALTLGVRGRRANVAEAVARRYAPRGRRLIEEALAREPANAWAHALMGAWHLEVMRRGGGAGATIYGARLSTGLAAFERARALAPEDAMIALQYAIALIEYDAEANAARAAALLAAADSHIPHDAFEARALASGRTVATALAQRGPRAAAAAARAAFR